MKKKSERISENTDRVEELSDLVNVLIGRIFRLEMEVQELREELNNDR